MITRVPLRVSPPLCRKRARSARSRRGRCGSAEGQLTHRNDAVRNVRQVEVKAIFDESALLLAHQVPQAGRHDAARSAPSTGGSLLGAPALAFSGAPHPPGRTIPTQNPRHGRNTVPAKVLNRPGGGKHRDFCNASQFHEGGQGKGLVGWARPRRLKASWKVTRQERTDLTRRAPWPETADPAELQPR